METDQLSEHKWGLWVHSGSRCEVSKEELLNDYDCGGSESGIFGKALSVLSRELNEIPSKAPSKNL